MGYVIPYDEVKRYKKSVLIDEDQLNNFKDGFVADNKVHSTDTVNSKGTFHGKDIIVSLILNQNLHDKKVNQILRNLKREGIERKDSIKLYYCQPNMRVRFHTDYTQRHER